jgi:hypothetical protein
MFQFPEKMKRVFRSKEHQERFERDGYIILPFYTPEEIAELTALYHRLHPQAAKGFFPSTFSPDREYRQTADREIQRVCQRSITDYCMDVKVMNGSFIVKGADAESGMCVHQDMTLVDEGRFTGINIWVPLCDLTVQNGGLFVLPKSHRIHPTYRGSTVREMFCGIMDHMLDYLHPVMVKAGQAVFFDQSIIHFSPPNYSDSPRIVTNTYFTHRDAEFRTCYFTDAHPGKVELFAQSDTFMTDFEQFGSNIHDRPTVGRSLGLVDYDFPELTVEFMDREFGRTDARRLIEEAAPKQEVIMEEVPAVSEPKRGFFQRLKELVS